MDEEYVYYTAFVNHHRLYRYSRIFFVLKNAPETFQRAVYVTLTLVKWLLAIVYIDFVITFSKSPQQHVKHVAEALGDLQKAEITVKLKKDHIFS